MGVVLVEGAGGEGALEGIPEEEVVAGAAFGTFEVGRAARVVGRHADVSAMGACAVEGHVFRKVGAMDQYAAVAAVDDEGLARVVVEADEVGLLQVEGAAFAEGRAADVAATGGQKQQREDDRYEPSLKTSRHRDIKTSRHRDIETSRLVGRADGMPQDIKTSRQQDYKRHQ